MRAHLRFLLLTSYLSLNLTLYQTTAQQQINKSRLNSAINFTDSLIENSPNQFFRNVRSMIIWYDGNILFEKYYNGCSKDSLNLIQSQTKSIVALLMGIAIDKGFVKNTDEYALRYFPEYVNTFDTLKAALKVRDLLTMSAGFRWEELNPSDDQHNDNINMFVSDNYLEYVLTRPMENIPGKRFKYNSGCPIITGGIIERATGAKFDSFAVNYLFNPLGITRYYWIKDTTGLCHAGGGLQLKPADMLKIGIMVFNKGTYNGKRIVSEQWINEMTQEHFKTTNEDAGYGYYWWINNIKKLNGGTTKMISAQGAGGQRMYIFPEFQLIVSFTESNYTTPLVSPLMIKEGIIPLLE